MKRRDFIWGASTLALFAAAYTCGINFSKTLAKSIKNIILPAGAENTNRMANKCLNCNLCVQNCPNKILEAANKDFSVVHIDYNKGAGFCEYNCHKCSQVCPSGAIKKISLQEKQHTRIAMASIKNDCIGCRHCVKACPVGAISCVKHEKAIIDSSKCIGCGRCKLACHNNSIIINPINKQSKI